MRHGGMARQCVHWRHSEEDDHFAKNPLLLFSFFSVLYLFETAAGFNKLIKASNHFYIFCKIHMGSG